MVWNLKELKCYIRCPHWYKAGDLLSAEIFGQLSLRCSCDISFKAVTSAFGAGRDPVPGRSFCSWIITHVFPSFFFFFPAEYLQIQAWRFPCPGTCLGRNSGICSIPVQLKSSSPDWNLSIYFQSVLLIILLSRRNNLWERFVSKIKDDEQNARLFIKNGFLSSFLYFLNYINGILIITNT